MGREGRSKRRQLGQEEQSTACMLDVVVILRKCILTNFIQRINQQIPRSILPRFFLSNVDPIKTMKVS